ncbi:hypothetical protein NHX12_000648 [Muraenolepis orangiensis]|uniref:FISNA domain-containing protein n=1 Tax=Muraenolepis orangiensis TaxID=630683 RepID=A0A9Q0D5S2_9TELE|nr:hypothetical protein NHX12_000648 [Muraenolepis orangiensis]
MQKFRRVFEGIAKAGKSTDLNDFYTELFITERVSGEVNKEHERAEFTEEERVSLMELLHHFFIQTKGIRRYDRCKVVFILDGLDECRLPLDFQNNPIWTDVTKSTRWTCC